MSETIRAAEKLLSTYFGRKHCILAGRATSALWLALRTIAPSGGKVVVPAIMCPNPANAVLYAGLELLFCDVSLENYNIDPVAFSKLIHEHDDIKAVIVVHLYGHPARLEEITRLANKEGISVIEDVAQAMGASHKGELLGSSGYVSILSFGQNKIPGLNGGGALLTDDDHIVKQVGQILDELPCKPIDEQEMQGAYRRLYYAIQDLVAYNIDTTVFFQNFPNAFKRMYLYKADEDQAQSIIEGLNQLQGDVVARRAKALVYRELLSSLTIEHPKVKFDEAAFWRYSLLVKGDARTLADRIREIGIDASNWYPNIAPWYGCSNKLENAMRVQQHVLNLWTDTSKSISEVRADCRKINEILRGM